MSDFQDIGNITSANSAMNKGAEAQSSPDTDNDTEVPQNDVELRKGEKARSHGKRRTAREIASMFEQLKHRHLLRKREWAEEKETLMKRLEKAEESKNVLSELKEILENLREELRLEERKRFQMELDHLYERKTWETERAAFLKKIEESAHESDRDGEGLRKLSEKMTEQANQINELQGAEIELKHQMLKKDRQILREKKDLHHQFETQRASWKKKEHELNKSIRELSNGKSSTSSLSPSSGDVRNPTRDFIEIEDTASNDQSMNQLIRGNGDEATSCSNFERKALKQIDKIRSGFHDYRRESDSLQSKSSDFKTSASASPLPNSVTKTAASKVPWRRTQRTDIFNEQHFDNEAKPRPSAESSYSLPSADATISLPSISNVKKLTPIPDRKFKKLNGQEPKMGICEFASSPDVPGQKYIYADDIGVDKTTEETSVTQSGIESSLDIKDPSLIDSLDDSNGAADIVSAVTENMKSSSSTVTDAATTAEKSTVARSTSPRLPKLHQQLLFKRDLTTSHNMKSQENETNSDFVGGNDFTYSDKILLSQPIKDHASTHTPYFAPSTGYAKGAKQRNRDAADKRPSTSVADDKQSNTSDKLLTENISKTRTKNDAVTRLESNRSATQTARDHNVSNITQAPAVHPKPKVSIRKDQDGNIIHVSPAVGKRSNPVGNAAPEKQYSIAERMGKAGRDWIRKKLHFKEKHPDEIEDFGQRAFDKKKGKQKHRRQSSLLKSKRESTSVTSSDDSSDGESRKRESLMRRNRRKGKSNASGASTKPKKYTRSKTDGSPREMKKFLSKFKSSQSGSKKPPVVQKFEKQLLENDIWTLKEEDGTIDAFDAIVGTPMPRKRTFDQEVRNAGRKDNASSYVQLQTGHGPGNDGNNDKVLVYGINDCSNGLTASQIPIMPLETRTSTRDNQSTSYLDDFNTSEDNSKTERLSVSRLVNRFSTHFDEENEDSRISPLRSSMRKAEDTTIPRRHSLTIHDGIHQNAHSSKGDRRDSDQAVYDTLHRDGFTWHDRMIALTESDNDDDISREQALHQTRSLRKKFQSLSNFWEDKHSNENDTNEIIKPRKASFMSNEMKQKTTILENALSKAPKKSRKYRRADTQPVAWRQDSDDEESSSVSEQIDIAYDMTSTQQDDGETLEEFCDEIAENMHETIPTVTSKFTKPSKPGRPPSRWAR